MQNIIKKLFDKNSPPVLIAEISANHNGSILNAKKLILAAKKNGADIVKLQTYEPKNMTINSSKRDFLINDGLWKGFRLWDLYKKAQTPLKWQKELFNYAKKIGIPCFSTPYDDEGVELLKKLDSKLFKYNNQFKNLFGSKVTSLKWWPIYQSKTFPISNHKTRGTTRSFRFSSTRRHGPGTEVATKSKANAFCSL